MKKILVSTALAAVLAVPSMALAHSPIFDCYDNGDGTVYCQGGFSDGSSAAGVEVNVLDGEGNIIETTALDSNAELTIDMPEGDYAVELNAGEGHSIVIDGENIVL